MGSASIAYIYELGAIISIVHCFALRAKNIFVVTIHTVQPLWIYLVNNADNNRLLHAYTHVQLRLIRAIKPELIL